MGPTIVAKLRGQLLMTPINTSSSVLAQTPSLRESPSRSRYPGYRKWLKIYTPGETYTACCTQTNGHIRTRGGGGGGGGTGGGVQLYQQPPRRPPPFQAPRDGTFMAQQQQQRPQDPRNVDHCHHKVKAMMREYNEKFNGGIGTGKYVKLQM